MISNCESLSSSGDKKKREIRTRYLSHTPGLRTCPSVKISNFEAHADMNIVHLKRLNLSTYGGRNNQNKEMQIITSQGHLPLRHRLLKFPSVRSLECSDEASE